MTLLGAAEPPTAIVTASIELAAGCPDGSDVDRARRSVRAGVGDFRRHLHLHHALTPSALDRRRVQRGWTWACSAPNCCSMRSVMTWATAQASVLRAPVTLVPPAVVRLRVFAD